MPSTIWNKYTLLKEFNSISNIRTYLARIELIIKEIIPKNINEYCLIEEKLQRLKNIIKIYDIIEENNRIYLVIDNKIEMIKRIDELLLSNELNINKEGILKDHGKPVTKSEILNLFKMENSMCKISFEKIINFKLQKGLGTGFFCEMNNFPIKYALFTNNHILNEESIKLGKVINFQYYDNSLNKEKSILINNKRKIITSKKLDYTCIELNEIDGIKHFFKIDPILLNNYKNLLQNSDIFILQFANGDELSFSYGKILSIEDSNIIHSASTEEGSSGSPIIRRCKDNYILGLHFAGVKNDNNLYSFNLAKGFDYILNDIINKIKIMPVYDNNQSDKKNEILCIYHPGNNYGDEVNLLYDFNSDIEGWTEENRKLYIDTGEKNKNFFKENLEIYINGKKIKFDYKYKPKEFKEFEVKFVFKKNITNMVCMFYNCFFLQSIDLSLFNSINVTNMFGTFCYCKCLESLKLSSFNTNKVTNMSTMFRNCTSLESLDLTSFNTNKVIDMSNMFSECKYLKSIDLSSFNTTNVKDMSGMFNNCFCLESIDLSLFETINVKNMRSMFYGCQALISLDLTSFNTINVTNMRNMFYNCISLQSINLSSFDTSNVIDMSEMFYKCSKLYILDLSSFNTNKVTNMRNMFYSCSSLQYLNLTKFNTNNANITGILKKCYSLKKNQLILRMNDKIYIAFNELI